MRTAPFLAFVTWLALAPLGRADTFLVSNTDGHTSFNSLLHAISRAEANPGLDVIEFALPGPPPFVISLTEIPTITDPLVIDGRTQPGWAGTPLVALDGSALGSSFVHVLADGCSFYGLSLHGFTGGLYLNGASFTTVQQCYVGVEPGGLSAPGNGVSEDVGAGITIAGGHQNLIGGEPGQGNLISGNTCGVRILAGASGTQVQGNLLGTDETGSEPLGTQVNGIVVHDAQQTLIRDNSLAFQAKRGVWVRDTFAGCCAGTACTISRNSIFCNGTAGIQLGHVLDPPNDELDADVGPNDLQNHPVLQVAVDLGGGQARVSGRLDSLPDTDFRIELFSNTLCTGGAGAGERYITSIPITTDANGYAGFAWILGGPGIPQTGEVLRATATDLERGNTSNFSPPLQVRPASSVLYVDSDAPGNQDGSSWEHALHHPQDAFDLAAVDPAVQEIRVARGIFVPRVERVAGDPRSVSFSIPSGLRVRGSFSGWGEPDPDFQDLETHWSVLYGDLGLNDTIAFCPTIGHGNFEENAYQVVDLTGTTPDTLLEGFTITHGNANGAPPFDSGGGIYMVPGSATVRHCTIRNNQAAAAGGGVYSGGGLAPTFEDCDIWVNIVMDGTGAGMSASAIGLMEIRRCSFRGNWGLGATDGGGLHFFGNLTRITNCEFSENETGGRGGGVYGSFHTAQVEVRNCTFNRNEAGIEFGGLSCEGSATARNSIFWGNTAGAGSVVEQQISVDVGAPDVQYCNVQGWTAAGTGNIDAAPRFLDDSSDCIGVSVDLRLFSDSPCIDAGDNTTVPADVGIDLAGQPRFRDDPLTADTGVGPAPVVDMGAFEYVRAEPGRPFCFGDGSGAACPCGNDVQTIGESCMHSGGEGMIITATGSTSIAADDLTIVVTQVPPGNAGLLYSGTQALSQPNLIWDGLQCALGDTRRYQAQFQSDGVFTDTGFVAQDPTGTYFAAGVPYHFQLWTRDAALPSTCGTGANYSPAYTVLMTP